MSREMWQAWRRDAAILESAYIRRAKILSTLLAEAVQISVPIILCYFQC